MKNLLETFVLLATDLLCDKTCPGETPHTYLLTPDRDPMIDQSTPPKLDEPMSLLELLMKMGEGLLGGAAMTQRQLHH